MARGFIDGEYEDGECRGLIFLAGKRGMGKTTELARMLSTCGGGVSFFDPLSKHARILPGFRIFSQPGPMVEYLRVNAGRRFRVLYQPRDGDMVEHFRAWCRILRAFGSQVAGVDELDMFCSSSWGPSRMPPEFNWLVHYGRHCRVSMVATARRPMDVARGFTSQCLSMRLFRITERADLRYFEDYIGGEVVALPRLDKYQYLHWRGDGDPSDICKGGAVVASGVTASAL